MDLEKDPVSAIEHEVVLLYRRADFSRTVDAKATMDRSAYLLLRKLEQKGEMGISTLADLFHLDISTVSRQTSALESKGFIQRFSAPADARINLLKITDAGLRELNAVRDARLSAYKELLADWSDVDRHAFAELLGRFNRALEQRKKSR